LATRPWKCLSSAVTDVRRRWKTSSKSPPQSDELQGLKHLFVLAVDRVAVFVFIPLYSTPVLTMRSGCIAKLTWTIAMPAYISRAPAFAPLSVLMTSAYHESSQTLYLPSVMNQFVVLPWLFMCTYNLCSVPTSALCVSEYLFESLLCAYECLVRFWVPLRGDRGC
jgi:hypothetical protein